MQTDIRKAARADLHHLKALAARVIDADYRAFLGDQGTEQIIDSGAIDDYLEENLGDCWVITCDGQARGFAVCKDALIALMMIAPEVRQLGVGSRLLTHCEAQLFQSHGTISLESFEGNTHAHEFYQRHGWLLTERNEHPNSGIHTYVFIKRDQP